MGCGWLIGIENVAGVRDQYQFGARDSIGD